MTFFDFLSGFILQMIFTIGLIFLFGKIIALCNARFYANFGVHAKKVCYITGFIGTPIHELSHAAMCLVFRHKIIEIRLFQIDSSDGTLGYVRHSFNPKSFYQRIGNLFIGIAPVLVGALLLALMFCLLMPELFSETITSINAVSLSEDFLGWISNMFGATGLMFSYIVTWQWWVFLLSGSLIALHMTLSKADVRGALSGLTTYTAAIFLTDIVLYFAGERLLENFTSALLTCGTFLFFFFCLFSVIAALAVIISYVFRLIFLRRKKI